MQDRLNNANALGRGFYLNRAKADRQECLSYSAGALWA